LTYEAEAEDEAMLINLQYALADALEYCRGISGGAKSDSIVIEQMIQSATLQTLLLLKLRRRNFAKQRAGLDASAA
jgi:hypothetical protein